MLIGPDNAARGREGGLGAEMTEGASWMRRKRRVADKAFITDDSKIMRGGLWSLASPR